MAGMLERRREPHSMTSRQSARCGRLSSLAMAKRLASVIPCDDHEVLTTTSSNPQRGCRGGHAPAPTAVSGVCGPADAYDMKMPVQLNHTIVAARDKTAAANFLATILGLRV